jgi:uncharacterized protein YhaN
VRIEQLELSRYGCFTDRVLDLSGPGVHLVVGPNEAGKSTVRRAFADLLYGIHERTTLGFLHHMSELRLAARVSGAGGAGEGAVLDLVRLKQRKAPLQTPEGEPLPESVLAALLAGVDRAHFESTFAIDHEELRIGGRQLLAGEGDLGAALFETSTNRRLTGMLDAIDEEMGKLFKRNAQIPVINATLGRIGEARKERDGFLLRPADYDRVKRAKDDAGKLRDRLAEEAKRVDTEYARLKRTMETKPLLADLAGLQQERAQLDAAWLEGVSRGGGSAPTAAFGAQIAEQLAAVRERASTAQAVAAHAATDQAEVGRKLAGLVVDDEVLTQAAEIERLDSERQAVQEAAEQEQRERKRAQKARERARALLGAGRLGGAADDGSDIAEARERAGALRAVLVGARADERLAVASDKGKQVTRLEKSIRVLREKHTLPDSVSDWPPLPVPAREQVTAFKEEFAGLDDRRKELARHRKEAAKSLAEHRRELDTVLAGDPPPTEAELIGARAARDAAWAELRDTVLTNESGAGYAEAVRHADVLADRMRREAQRQTDRVRLEVAVGADEQAVEEVGQLTAELDRDRGDVQARWAAAWLPSALPAPDPHAATELLAGIDELIDKAKELADVQVDLDVCLAEIEAAEVRLRQVLGSPVASMTAPAEAGLAELVALAEQRQTEYAAADKQRDKAEGLFADADDLEAEADHRARRVSRFAESVAAVAATCAGSDGSAVGDAGPVPSASSDALAGTDAYAAIAALRERLQSAQNNAAVAAELRDRAAKLDAEAAAAAAASAAAAADVVALIETAGVEDETRLDALVQRSAQAADLDRRISDLTSPLARTGVPLATLVLEAADWPDPDELAARVAQLERDREESQAELQAASEEFGSRKTELEAMDGSALAAGAAERLAEQQAVLIEHSEEYLRLHLGKQLLLHCAEEYRQANQDPVLSRAKELFTTLTGGRFTELLAEQDSHGKDVLRVRRAGGAVVGIGPELSEGTLDQVYLALRLAALQRYADAGRTMPLVFDDIFITSDDERTAAGLATLDGIADQFQVVVFTHHAHMAELARAALPAGRVHITELPSSSVALA